jgi:thioredoxin 1
MALVVVSGCERASVKESPSADAETALGDATVAALPVLLDLGSDSCVACKTMAPILDEMRETLEGQIHVRFVDVRKNRSMAAEHGVKVIPTQIFFDEDGRELFRHQGFYGRENILAKWAELGYTFDEPVPAVGGMRSNG